MAKNKKPTYEQAISNTKKKNSATVTHSVEKKKWAQWAPKVIPPVLILVALIATGLRLISLESEILYKSQELSLWIDDDTFYQMFSIYPGGWLSYAGSYMTQFFYHPATGVWMLMAAWALITLLLRHLYKLKGWKMLLAALVPIMLLAAFTQTGYWIYYQKLHGHLWVPTLGILISLAAAVLYKGFCNNIFVIKTMVDGVEVETKGSRISRYIRFIMSLIWMLVFGWYGYRYMGAWSFAGLGIMATLPLNTPLPKSYLNNLISVPIALAIVYFVPRIAYNSEFEQTIFNEIYTAGMPCFRYGFADIAIYRKAYYLLALCFLPMVLVCQLPKTTWEKKSYRYGAAIVLIALLGLSVHFCLGRWNHDKNLHAEVAMSNAIDRQDWEGALNVIRSTASDTIAPTRAMVMMKNLSLFRLGRVGNEMFNYPEGSRLQNIDEYYKYGDKMYNFPAELDTISDAKKKEDEKSKHRWQIRLTQIAGKKLYYNYGKLNFCYRWCMEDAVEFGWQVEGLKLMALCSMLKGEDVVAEKYFNILKKTRYHKEWAEKYEAFLGQPEKIKAAPEFSPICYLMNYGDRLDGDNTLIELYLLQTFANGRGADPIYQEATLMCAMLMKDIQLFWPRFSEYATMHSKEPNFKMPRHYQEAAYLYGQLEPQTRPANFEQMPFDQSVKDTYQQFMAFNNQPHIAPLSEAEKAKQFKPQFGNTFYYFYFLVRNQKTN